VCSYACVAVRVCLTNVCDRMKEVKDSLQRVYCLFQYASRNCQEFIFKVNIIESGFNFCRINS
jgi:hypothetical protein